MAFRNWFVQNASIAPEMHSEISSAPVPFPAPFTRARFNPAVTAICCDVLGLSACLRSFPARISPGTANRSRSRLRSVRNTCTANGVAGRSEIAVQIGPDVFLGGGARVAGDSEPDPERALAVDELDHVGCVGLENRRVPGPSEHVLPNRHRIGGGACLQTAERRVQKLELQEALAAVVVGVVLRASVRVFRSKAIAPATSAIARIGCAEL